MKEVKVFLQRCILVASEVSKIDLELFTKKEISILKQKQKPVLSKTDQNQIKQIVSLRKSLKDIDNKLRQKDDLLKILGPENASLREKLKIAQNNTADTEKLYTKYNRLLDLYNKLTNDYKYQKKELESLKASQSSGTFINKIKQEKEDHDKTKKTLAEITQKYNSMLLEFQNMKKNQIQSILSQSQQGRFELSGDTQCDNIDKNKRLEIDSANSENNDTMQSLNSVDMSNVPAKVIELFQKEIKKRDESLNSIKQDNIELKNHMNELTDEITDVQNRYEQILKYSDSITNQNIQYKAENHQLGDKIQSLLEKVDEISQNFQCSRDELNLKVSQYKEENKKLSEFNKNLHLQISQQEVNKMKQDCNCSEYKSSIQTLNKVNTELKNQLKDLREKLNEPREQNNYKSNYNENVYCNGINGDRDDSKYSLSSEPLQGRIIELSAEIEMKDKLIRYFMTGNQDIDLSNFFKKNNDITSANFVNIYNESITKMQKILEEQLLKNIDLNQNLNRVNVENNLLTEELEKARAILNSR